MPRQLVPVPDFSSFEGTVLATTVAEGTFVLTKGGLYALTALEAPLNFKTSAGAITNLIGSVLPENDTVIIQVPANTTLRFIRAITATADGRIGITEQVAVGID